MAAGPGGAACWPGAFAFFLTAALTASKTPGGYAPFALGVAAAGPGGQRPGSAGGAGVGAVLFLDFADALPFLATAVLIFTTAAACGESGWKRTAVSRLAGAGLFLAVSGIYVLQSCPLETWRPALRQRPW